MNMNKHQFEQMCALVAATHTREELRQALGVGECETLDELVFRGAEVLGGGDSTDTDFDTWWDRAHVGLHLKRITDEPTNQ